MCIKMFLSGGNPTQPWAWAPVCDQHCDTGCPGGERTAALVETGAAAGDRGGSARSLSAGAPKMACEGKVGLTQGPGEKQRVVGPGNGAC